MKKVFLRVFIALFIFPAVAFTQSDELHFEINRIPFSCRGSYLAISHLTPSSIKYAQKAPEGIFIRNISRRNFYTYMIRVELLEDNKVITPEIDATPSKLTLKGKFGFAEFCFENPSIIRMRGKGLTIKLSPIDKNYAVPVNNHQWRFLNGLYNDFFYMATSLKGTPYFKPLSKAGAESPTPNRSDDFFMTFSPDSSGTFETALEEFESEWVPRTYTKPFDSCVAANKEAFRQWLQPSQVVQAAYSASLAKAEYQNWSAMVAPRGQLKKETMLMSKNWMNTYYSWDHCFNAIALAPEQPKEAWEQMTGIFDHQSKLGSLPDCVDDEKEAWGILKTPVHGWALQKMMEVPGMITRQRIEEIYPHLAAWTNFWFTYRDPDGNGLPQYNHSFESFDDTPPFDVGLPIEGPELATFLVLQMNTLEKFAKILAKTNEAIQWKRRADTLTQKMIAQLWNGEQFISKNAITGEYTKGSESFISYVPLLLGNKLPADIRKKLIDKLKREGTLLTSFGFANESLKSPFFNTDSYTRGSVWAPVNYILIDGLEACSEHDFAREVALRYCNHLVKSGFSERQDAISGQPLSDPAYTWTSSVFITLVHRYFKTN